MSVCRICLATNAESSINISATVMEYVNQMIPPMSSNLKLVCETCSESFLTSYQFINTAIKTENKILEQKRRLKVDIVDLSIFHSPDKSPTNERNVCRTCLKLISKPQIFLTPNSTNIMHHKIVRNMLEACDIYLKHELTEKPVMCIDCWVALQAVYTFKKDYLDIREKVIQFCKLQNYCLQNINEEALTVMKQFINEDLDLPDLSTSKSNGKCFTKADDLLLLHLYYEISKIGLEIPNGYIHAIQEMWSEHRSDESPPPKTLIMFRLNMMLHTDMLSYEEKEKVKADVRLKMSIVVSADISHDEIQSEDTDDDQFVDKGISKSGINGEPLQEVIMEEHSHSVHIKDMKAPGEMTKNREHDSCNSGNFSTSRPKRHLATNDKVDNISTHPIHSCDIKERSYSDDEDQLLELIEPAMNLDSDLDCLFDIDPHLSEANRPLSKMDLSFSDTEQPLYKTDGPTSEANGFISELEEPLSEIGGPLSEPGVCSSEGDDSLPETNGFVSEADGSLSEDDIPLSEVDIPLSEVSGFLSKASSLPLAHRPLSEVSEVLTESFGPFVEANKSLSEVKGLGGLSKMKLTTSEAGEHSPEVEGPLSKTKYLRSKTDRFSSGKNELLVETERLSVLHPSSPTLEPCLFTSQDIEQPLLMTNTSPVVVPPSEGSKDPVPNRTRLGERKLKPSYQSKEMNFNGFKPEALPHNCTICDYCTIYSIKPMIHGTQQEFSERKQVGQRSETKLQIVDRSEPRCRCKESDSVGKKCQQCRRSIRDVHLSATHPKNREGSEIMHACMKCDYTTNDISQFTEHMKLVHDEDIYWCDSCHYNSNKPEEYDEHMSQQHTGDKQYRVKKQPYKCYKCDFRSVSVKRFINHMKELHNSLATQAQLPSMSNKMSKEQSLSLTLEESSSLTKQLVIEITQLPLEEKLLQMTNMSTLDGSPSEKNEKLVSKGFTQRKNIVKPCKKFKCKKCPFSFSKFHNFKRHLLETHSEDISSLLPYKCTMCDYRCRTTKAIGVHQNTHELANKEQLVSGIDRPVSETKQQSSESEQALSTAEKQPMSMTNISKNNEEPVLERACWEVIRKDHTITKTHELLLENAIEEQTCESRTNRSDNLKLRQMSEQERNLKENDNSFQCDSNKSSSNSYILIEHDKSILTMYSCYNCDFKSQHKGNLKIHIMAKHFRNSSIKKYSCGQCDYKTHYKIDLNRHVLTNHDKTVVKKYGCDQCNYKTNKIADFNTHVLAKHDNMAIKKYSCDYCDYKSYEKHILNNHVLAKHDKMAIKKYSCDQCDFETHHNSAWNRHVLVKHDNMAIKRYSCDHCEYKTHNKSRLNSHVLTIHDKVAIKKYSCDYCDYRSHFNGNLRRHMNIQHVKINKKYVCDHCDYKAHHKDVLNRHVLVKHDTMAIKKYGCDHCDYKTHNKADLSRHVLVKHDKMTIKKYGCDQCDFKTHIKSVLDRHILAKHDKTAIKKYDCDQCDFKTHHKYVLNGHLKTKHDKMAIKKYYCDQCDFKAPYKCHLNRHILAKHDKMAVKKYDCDQCDFKTNYKNSFHNHILAKHDKMAVKKYSCYYCDYSSHQNGNLQKHIRSQHVKTSIKKICCDQCDYKTHNKHALYMHILVKHDKMTIKKYDCDQCDFKTHYKNSFHNHILAKHDKMAVKKYSCYCCDYSTHKNGNLRRHIRSQHVKRSIKNSAAINVTSRPT